MSIFSRLLAKDNSITRVEFNNLFEWMGWKSSTGFQVTKENAIEVSSVFCAVRVIAEGIAQMPVRIRRREMKGDREYFPNAQDHYAWKLMTRKPNDWMTPYEFKEFAVMIAALCGNFIAIKNVVNKEVRELLPVPPGAWTMKQDDDFGLVYEIKGEKDKIIGRYTQAEVFHLRGPSLDGFSGLESIAVAREIVGLSRSLEQQQSKLSANGGRPSGVLSSENPISPEKAQAIKDAWTAKFGQGGDGGIAVLDGGWKFHSMQMTGVDAQHLETRKHQIEEVARAFRVFPQMLMQSDKTSTFASAEQFFRAHVVYTLGPWATRFEQVCDRDVLFRSSKYYTDLDERNLLRGDFADQADYYSKALGSGGTPAWMTQNDVRAETGLPPKDDPKAEQLFNGFQADNTQPDDGD